jgi:hypothetical protein
MRLGLYEPIKVALGATDPARTPLYLKIAAGSLAGCVSATLTNALDVIKVVHASPPQSGCPPAGGSAAHIHGPVHMGAHLHPLRHFAWMYAAGGVRGLFVGIGPNVFRGVVVNSAQVPAYDQTKHALLNAHVFREGTPLHFAASLTASLVAVAITNPIDVVKTNVMAGRGALVVDAARARAGVGAPGGIDASPPAAAGPGASALPQTGRAAVGAVELRAPSATEVFRHLVRSGGVRRLYSGAVASWLRLGPHTIVTFVVFEWLRRAVGVAPL